MSSIDTSHVSLTGDDTDITIGISAAALETKGIGGLHKEFNRILQACASRAFPPAVIAELGVSHVKGILLYGPPGTGKTLIAREIGTMLNCRYVRIANGSDILSTYVGQNNDTHIRTIFADAESEYAEKGDNSSLHVIVFEHIDALCKRRYGTSTETCSHGHTVNHLFLNKIDAISLQNNVLIIGTTSRKDLLDEALFRPGRFEVQIEFKMPSLSERLQILNIHTSRIREKCMLCSDVDLEDLARRTVNCSGAGIQSLVRIAVSAALHRHFSYSDGGINAVNSVKNVKIDRADFEHALTEITPACGCSDQFLENAIVHFSPSVDKLLQTGDRFVRQVATSDRMWLGSILLEGPQGSGKTALVERIAKSSLFSFVRKIDPEMFVTDGDTCKAEKIGEIFYQAYKSPLSCIVIDDLEQLLEFVRVGPHFSAIVLRTLLVFLRRRPPAGCRLLVIATTSDIKILQQLEFAGIFSTHLQVPLVANAHECCAVLLSTKLFSSDRVGEGEEGCLESATRAFASALTSSNSTRGVPVKQVITAAEMCMRAKNSTSFSASQFERAMRKFMDTDIISV